MCSGFFFNKNIYVVLLLVSYCFVSLVSPQNIHSCTAFSLSSKDNEMVVGYNLDWHTDEGYLIKNNRNVQKTAFPTGTNKPVSWKSKFGSVTFNQYGKEFPSGGINEQGLVVENLTLLETEYPYDSSRPTISESQWIQYQLDNSISVDEVIKTDLKLFIVPQYSGVHYFVADVYGNSGIIEFVDGKMTYHISRKYLSEVITNDTYERSMQYLKNINIYKAKDVDQSLSRYKRALDMLNNYGSISIQSIIDYAFQILSNVSSSRGGTKWSTVYDNNNKIIFFKTIRQKEIKIVDLSFFDFDASTPVLAFDLNSPLSGNVSEIFEEYTYDMNKNLITKTIPKLGFSTSDPRFNPLLEYQFYLNNVLFDLPENVGTLKINVSNLKHDNGFVQIGIMNSRESYENLKPFKSATVDIVNGKSKFIAYNLPYGEYAVGLFHDENGNSQTDKFIFFIEEPYGFSNNARGLFGVFKPDYDKVRFNLKSKKMKLDIKVN